MNSERTEVLRAADNPLTPEQQALLEEVQRMYDSGCEEIPEEFVARANPVLKWSWDDPLSIERSLYFAARDPYYLREMRAISADFACAEGDGLEDY